MQHRELGLQEGEHFVEEETDFDRVLGERHRCLGSAEALCKLVGGQGNQLLGYT